MKKKERGELKMGSSLSKLLVVSVVGVLLVGCQTPKKGPPPPDYMAEMDSISMSFEEVAQGLERIGDGLSAIEKERFVLSPDLQGEGLSDEDAIDRLDGLLGILDDVQRLVKRNAEKFTNNTKIPGSKDRNGLAVYEAHNDAMKDLFIALLGKGDKKDEDIRLTPLYSGATIAVRTAGNDEDARKFRVEELEDKGLILVPDGVGAFGYLTALEDFLQINQIRLRGIRQVTICRTKKIDKNEFSCVAKNNPMLSERGSSLLNDLVGFMYDRGGEKRVVVAMKQLMRMRTRITDYLGEERS